MQIYNTLSHQVETFQPINPSRVKIYTCGPTVYSSPHIGNFAAYVYWDLLLRTLRLNGYKPYRVLNLTDVGHLTSDADEGEDKLEKGAREHNQTVWEVAEHYIAEFKRDFHALKLLEPDVWARATDYIAADLRLVDELTARGYTYETKDGIYYDTSKFPHYADLARLDLEQLRAGARVEFSQEKRHAADFAVWKFIQPGEKHAMRWDYLGRPGYPGWHLECSTIIHEELGETIDIHTGGIDHIPVHHTNEIAQSEAAFDKQLAKYWLHCNHLTSESAKISKSLGNGYTLQDLIERGYSPLDFKLWVFQGHYQSERNFSLDDIAAAAKRRLNWRNQIAKSYQIHETQDGRDILQNVRTALNDNLNSPAAFAWIDQAENCNLEFWQQIDEIFGLGLIDDSPDVNTTCREILEEREIARQQKDYAKSDQLREKLKENNLTVLDSPIGQVWQYIK